MIRVLSAEVANKIAAGEVIERPASVVKELIENSLDAEADDIRVELLEGGKKLIRVTDNGHGMGADDLALAFMPHATSKIANVDDLFHIVSYGFRGEALASIGSVARASIVSRIPGQPLGHRVSCERSEISDVLEAGGPEGTIIEIKDLFYNVPARRKFLKSDGAEVAQISEAMTRMALAQPHLRLELLHNTRKVMSCTPEKSLDERIVRLFGKDLVGQILAVHDRRDGVEVSGFIGSPDVARGSASRQYVFLNDRFIKDRSVVAAVARGYEGFLMPRRYPVFFLKLTVDPETVDVNVHPTKVEVRFRHKNTVFTSVQAACRRALEAERPANRLVVSAPERVQEAGAAEPAPLTRRERATEIEQQLFGKRAAVDSAPATRREAPKPGPQPSTGCRLHATADQSPGYRFLQIHSSYILVEDESGFYIIDQHALHERMLYEQLMERSARGEIASQRLLCPQVIDLSPAEHAQLDDLREELASIGLVLSPFGGSSMAIEEVPVDLQRCSPEKLIEAALANESESVTEGFRGLKKRLLAGMACRAAVKFNDTLGDDEIRALLDWERSSVDSAACPHGRPTRIRMTLSELERQFLRKE